MRVVVRVFPEPGSPDEPQELVFEDKEEISFGRSPDNDVVLASDLVSRHHARLQVRPGRVILSDLQSGNGVFVSGRRIAGPVIVKGPLPIAIGKFRIEVEV